MITLKGNDLMNYLGKLKTEVQKFDNPELHSPMIELIEAEEKFYNSVPEGGRALAFSGNGLFSVDSLKADLETMCGEDDFKEIAGKYKRGIKKSDEEDNKYKKVSENKWKEEKENHNLEDLSIKKGFEFKETEDGRFELKTREEFYVNGIDDYSKKFPVMFRDFKVEYQSLFKQVFAKVNQEFFVFDKEPVISGRSKLKDDEFIVEGKRYMKRNLVDGYHSLKMNLDDGKTKIVFGRNLTDKIDVDPRTTLRLHEMKEGYFIYINDYDYNDIPSTEFRDLNELVPSIKKALNKFTKKEFSKEICQIACNKMLQNGFELIPEPKQLPEPVKKKKRFLFFKKQSEGMNL